MGKAFYLHFPTGESGAAVAHILKPTGALLAVALWAVAGPVLAQRVQFPSMLSSDPGSDASAGAMPTTSIPVPPPLSSVADPSAAPSPAPAAAPLPPPATPAAPLPSANTAPIAVLAQAAPPYSAPVAPSPPGYGAPSTYPGGNAPPYTSPNYTAPPYTTPAAPGPAPSSAVAPAPATPYTSPNPYPAGAPATFPAAPWPGAGGPPPAYGATPVPGAAPATLPGSILPPPSWDPYATPAPQQPSLFPQNPFLPGPGGACPTPAEPLVPMTRLVQEIRGDYTLMGDNSYNSWGFNQVEVSGTGAVPLLNVETPLLVTPGIVTYFLTNPTVAAPHEFYDAYLDGAWNPQLSPGFGAELNFRVGVYSDFNRVTAESIRYTGHGLAVISLSPDLKLKGGVVYLDRLYIKMLPAGGVVWTPNPDFRADILFPNPKITHRIATYGITDWWVYGRAEYGGDDWTSIGFWTPTGFQTFADGGIHRIDYNDIRAAVGLDFNRHGGINGLVEAGIAFEREIRNGPDSVSFNPGTTYFIQGSIAF